jgi:hypothetical protein
MTTTNHTDLVLQLTGFIAGINKHYAGQTLSIAGQSVTASNLVTTFQACIDALAAVKLVETQRTATIAKATAAIATAAPLAKGLKAVVLGAYSGDPTTLGDFDVEPHKVAVISTEVRAAAAKKGAATRKALGTLGAAQKKAAKKALATSATTTAPSTPPATPAPAAPVVPKS